MPERDPAGGLLHRGWAWTVEHPRLIPAGYWVAGLFVAFALGNVPSLVTGDWKTGMTWVSLWLSVGSVVVAAIAFGLAEIGRRGQRGMIQGKGTAYIIQEYARFWDKDTAERFREGIRRQFARVVQVPGPVELGRGWDWSLDHDAWDWDAKLHELVRAFRVLTVDEARGGEATPNGVFLWAYWAIAAAFGMRVTAADRDLVLDVWQRPSKARAGKVEPEIWAQRPHRFDSEPADGTGPQFEERVWSADLEYSWIAQRRGWTRRRAVAGEISVLLIRFSASGWGPLPPVGEQPPGEPLTLRLRTAVRLPAVGSSPVAIHELRCVPPLTASGERQFPWDQFPALAAKAAAWIEDKAQELDGHTLVLGTLVPQEVGLGLGIHAGQVSRRVSWPALLWPVVLDPSKRDLVVPNLQLGSAAVDPALGDVGGA
jgi:hypothetical protein